MTTLSPGTTFVTPLADGLDDAGTLVPEHDRLRRRQHAVADDEVGVADTGRDDPDEDLARPWVVELEHLERHAALGARATAARICIRPPSGISL